MTTLKEDERTKDAPLAAELVVQLTPKEAFQLVLDEVAKLVKDLDSVGQTTLSVQLPSNPSSLLDVYDRHNQYNIALRRHGWLPDGPLECHQHSCVDEEYKKAETAFNIDIKLFSGGNVGRAEPKRDHYVALGRSPYRLATVMYQKFYKPVISDKKK